MYVVGNDIHMQGVKEIKLLISDTLLYGGDTTLQDLDQINGNLEFHPILAKSLLLFS